MGIAQSGAGPGCLERIEWALWDLCPVLSAGRFGAFHCCVFRQAEQVGIPV